MVELGYYGLSALVILSLYNTGVYKVFYISGNQALVDKFDKLQLGFNEMKSARILLVLPGEDSVVIWNLKEGALTGESGSVGIAAGSGDTAGIWRCYDDDAWKQSK